MKRLFPAILCIAAALALSAGSFLYIKTQTEKLGAAMDAVLEGDDSFRDALALCESWKKVRIPFGALLKHSDADELEKYFIQIGDYALSEQPDKLTEAVENCRTALRVILKGEKLDVANIF